MIIFNLDFEEKLSRYVLLKNFIFYKTEPDTHSLWL